MESSTNRFADADDQPIDGRELKQLMANCDKWSLKNDLELLSHLKQLSNDLITKTENTSHSIDSLVFETKIHSVRVDNVINEFQMLANCQFVENRVYDEEMEDIIANGSNVVSIEPSISSKTKDEEILPKIKSALNIGLDFLNQRFDCVSKPVIQNDSDDENDSIVEGLVSDSSRDEYSQRLLPYIIGSEDFIKDNFVGLSSVEESPVIDLKTRIENDVNSDVKSVVSVEPDSDTFAVRNTTSNANHLIEDLNDSEEEESVDIFSAIPRSLTNNERHVSSDESDFDEPNEENLFQQTDDKIESESKSIIRSFNDELSAAISAKNPNKQLSVGEERETNSIFETNKSRTQTSKQTDLEFDSSDDNDSIFKISKNKTKTEVKQKTNFSNLFGEEENDNSLFDEKLDKRRTKKDLNKVLPISEPKKVISKTSRLFEDEDEDDDDLFGGTVSKKITETKRPNVVKEEVKRNVLTRDVSEIEKRIVEKKGLFDDDEDDDIFSGISVKSNQNSNSDVFASKVKPTNSPNLIKELSSALKKKTLYQNSESDSNSEDNDFTTNSEINKNVFSDSNSEKVNNFLDSNEKVLNDSNESISVDNKVNDIKDIEENNLSQDIPSEVLAPKEGESSDSNIFNSNESTVPLSNDVLKHRAMLGSQRNRRPPSKRVLKLTPITDFNKDLKPKAVVSLVPEEKLAPIAATRTLKNQSMTNSIDKTLNNSEFTGNSSTDEQKTKSLNTLVKSPSTEEEDIFPTQANNTKTTNISKMFEKSKTSSLNVFDDFDDNDDSLFSSGKAFKTDISQKIIDKSGLFDTSDSEDEEFISNISSKSDPNMISNLIKPSNSDLFNDISSTDSSLSNKSELKVENSKQTLTLFSDSDDEDLFSLVNKTKSNKTESISETKKLNQNSEQRTEKSKNMNSFFSDSEDDKSDLFKKSEDIKQTKETKPKSKPVFDFDDDNDNDDIFLPKPPKANTSKPLVSSKTKPKTLSESSDLFDDPLFASRY